MDSMCVRQSPDRLAELCLGLSLVFMITAIGAGIVSSAFAQAQSSVHESPTRRIAPYVQDVTEDSIAIVWWSGGNQSGSVDWGLTSSYGETAPSIPTLSSALTTVVGGVEQTENHPYRHEVRLSSLQADTTYYYRVTQGAGEWMAQFTTEVGPGTGFAFAIALSSSEPSTNWDTGRYSSHPLVGENEPPEPGGQGNAPDIHGRVHGESDSLQYEWLVETLQQASVESPFLFVVNHQPPYSSFVHGAPGERQSGYPIRKLDGLFHHYGVDAVFSGHDESYERSVTSGTEAGGPVGEHEIHYYVLPTIGDPTGLRDPESNPTWQEGFSQYVYPLDSKKFGYVGVNIEALGGGNYRATITPYYLDPLDPTNPDIFYDDVVQITGSLQTPKP